MDTCTATNNKTLSSNSSRSFGAHLPWVIASVALLALSLPGRPLPWLGWVAMAPLFVTLRHAKPLHGFLLGGLFGWLTWLSAVWWLQFPLRDMLGMSIPIALLLTIMGCLLPAMPYALGGAIICRFKSTGIFGSLRVAAVFTALIVFFTPVFEGHLAHTQYQHAMVIQVVELGGVPLLLFLMLGVNCLCAEAFGNFRAGVRIVKPIFAVIGILAFVVSYGIVRLGQFESEMKNATARQWLKVASIQPNIPIRVSADRQPIAGSNTLFTAVKQATDFVREHPDLDLIVFPENPATFLFNHDSARRDAVGQLIRSSGKPVLLNADAIEPTTNHLPPLRYNVAIWLDPNRNIAGHYAKMKRIPLVEYIPGERHLPALRKFFPQSQRVLQGTGPAVFEIQAEARIIPLICYEATSARFTRQFVRRGGNFIVNQVNDSWFLRTGASEIHLALALFRSVENRVPMVRVTNSGIGGHIDASGRMIAETRTELFTEAVTAAPLFIPEKRSVYAQMGNYWMFGLLVFALSIRRRSDSGSKECLTMGNAPG